MASSHPSIALESWLEVIDGDQPLLLITPHGGRAGAAAAATLHPKVNDLETAEITRDVARRLRAPALINCAMDRNQLDCNRLSQLAQRAPWLLELIAEQLAAIISRHGHATVLLVHGWNIIEPRIDFGLGLRESGGKLSPPGGAHVAAADDFIQGPVMALAARLRDAEIIPTFGLRYPGGAAQNLLQGFTPRHAGADIAPVRRLSSMAAKHTINAMQLEMSVALRLPGTLRERAIQAICQTFSNSNNGNGRFDSRLAIIRAVRPPAAKKVAVSNAPPSRVGVEFYDPVSNLGGMVSFDFGPGASGGRIMMLFDGSRVALFTAEGKAERTNDRIFIGPLVLDASHRGTLQFRGPCVIVEDGTAYLSVERALASSRLDQTVEVDARLEFDAGAPSFGDLLSKVDELLAGVSSSAVRHELAKSAPPRAAYGRLRGTIQINGARRELDAAARIGASFTGLGPQRFVTRRMLWASFRRGDRHNAFEGRTLEFDDQAVHRIARTLRNGEWIDCTLADLQVGAGAKPRRPEFVRATAFTTGGDRIELSGQPQAFVVLSRPGLDGSRIHTILGFAEYQLDGMPGAGMYELSRQVGRAAAAGEAEE
jgi:hypothetical protein